jgi:hypothetical protein
MSESGAAIAVAKAKLTAIGITDFIFDADLFVSFLPTEQHTRESAMNL